jgi:uncharacterized membrane protein AbrB (regulator of aidB expression)
MSVLDWEFVEFWIIVVFGLIALVIYQVQAKRWTFNRVWHALFNAVVVTWSAIGLTSAVHVTDVKHWLFFAAVDLIVITEAIMVGWVACKELRHNRKDRP